MDLIHAKQVLDNAYSTASAYRYAPKSKFKNEISTVLNGHHKTYKYIMINALLAKSAFPDINPLCLQAGSALDGAYDARSVCHDVLVPFEKNKLTGILGDSNEPFLNKPARFPELSLGNAVRRGKDKKTLELLCSFLPRVTSSDIAFQALSYSLYYCLRMINERNQKISSVEIIMPTFSTIDLFIEDLLKESHGGECLALAVGVLSKTYNKSLIGTNRADVHKVNQAGSSTKEVEDIDVYSENALSYAIEVKDKTFAPQDVLHAVEKTAKSECERLLFIKGPRGILLSDKITEADLINLAKKAGVFLCFLSYSVFSKVILSIILPSCLNDFFNVCLNVAAEARLRDETMDYLFEVAQRNGLIK